MNELYLQKSLINHAHFSLFVNFFYYNFLFSASLIDLFFFKTRNFFFSFLFLKNIWKFKNYLFFRHFFFKHLNNVAPCFFFFNILHFNANFKKNSRLPFIFFYKKVITYKNNSNSLLINKFFLNYFKFYFIFKYTRVLLIFASKARPFWSFLNLNNSVLIEKPKNAYPRFNPFLRNKKLL